MNEPMKTILLPNGKNAVEWTKREKPSLNHWYLCKDSDTDYWKIAKDYHSPETKQTYYKIVDYYNGISFIVVTLLHRYAKSCAITRIGW